MAATSSDGASNGAETCGLPPTPPTNSRDDTPPGPDGSRVPMPSRKSSLGTPVNQRSPPTPDPSPPRTSESMKLPVRPFIFAYPSSRAESFKTAREDQASTDGSDAGAATPVARHDCATPPGRRHSEQVTPQRSWDPELMRNVTVRKKRNPPQSPQKTLDRSEKATPTALHPSPASHRHIASSPISPNVQSIEAFAHSIGWPAEPATTPKQPAQNGDAKRHSASSMASTVVEAMVIVTPEKNRRRTLRHSGKNLALRRDEQPSPTSNHVTQSNRTSLHSDDIPLHRLVHKRASISERQKRMSTESSTLGTVRTSSPLSVHHYTLAHQESVRNVLQPAADMLSRSNSLSRAYASERGYHKRISSAPEPARRAEQHPLGSRTMLGHSPTQSPRKPHASFKSPLSEQILPSTPQREESSIRSSKVQSEASKRMHREADVNKSLPHLPIQKSGEFNAEQISDEKSPIQQPREILDMRSKENHTPSVAKQYSWERSDGSPQNRRESPGASLTVNDPGSLTSPGRSEETHRRSTSHERTPTSNHSLLRPSLDRIPTEELSRRSYESRSPHADDNYRISLDRTTTNEEHALARHLFASATPFSQFSDTPIEVSEATAVSIYPHNNHSLLVVQQMARSSTLPLLDRPAQDDRQMLSPSDPSASQLASQALMEDFARDEPHTPNRPTVTIEPSTPPMQLSLPVPGAVDSPLKNPRVAPEPPVIKFIPPTPADELEVQLGATLPGPPERSNSHPQRRLSLVQRARRYSEDLISPFLARASSTRGRYVSDSHGHEKPRVPTVNDGDGALHPFWRPRGFWDGFDDSDSEDDERLPQGGDTSEVEDPKPQPETNPRKLGVLGRRLTNGLKGPTGFLIGNSLGVERSGTNRRRPRIILPSQRAQRPSSPPMIFIQRPTMPLGGRSGRVEKRNSQASMRPSDRSRREGKKEAWRTGRKIPRLQVQYIGLSGVKERLRERKAEKRRDEIRKSIGSRYYVEDGLKPM